MTHLAERSCKASMLQNRALRFAIAFGNFKPRKNKRKIEASLLLHREKSPLVNEKVPDFSSNIPKATLIFHGIQKRETGLTLPLLLVLVAVVYLEFIA